MNFVALRMLTGDRAKYVGLIFAIAFSTFLLENQSSIFAGIMKRTTSQILDVIDADIWVMDKKTQYIDEVKALTDNDLYRVRGVPGVLWAVRLFKGQPRAKALDGTFRVVIMMGLDDVSLVGAPARDQMLLGSVDNLRQPDAAIIDRAGYHFLFPGQPLGLGSTLELNDHLVRIVGVAEASAPFATFPVMFARYSQAIKFVGRERNHLSFVLVKPQPGVAVHELCDRIEEYTDLRAVSGVDFALANGALLHQEYGHPGQLRYHHWHCPDCWRRGSRANLLHLHARKPQAVWRAEGDWRDEQAHRRHDPVAGLHRCRHRLCDWFRHRRCVLLHDAPQRSHAWVGAAVAEHGRRGGCDLPGGLPGQSAQHSACPCA
jgi:hypothetical protein